MFITFEGIDGCGKSTQARLLAELLRSQGREVVATREPGGTPLAEEIRALVLGTRGAQESAQEGATARAELLLFAAARAQHVDSLIRPALERGACVLCDRFTDSTLAYQSGGLGLEEESVRALNHFATGGLEPSLTLLFDVDALVAQQRRAVARGGSDRIESRGLAFQESVRRAFLEEAARSPRRIAVIDASPGVDEVHSQLLQVLAGHEAQILASADV